MANPKQIVKIGAVVMDADRLLLVKKRGGSLYILPGGKPEPGEDDIKALDRELNEELGCRFHADTIEFLGSFSDAAAELLNTIVTVRLYSARLLGNPMPMSEIETLKWFSPDEDGLTCLAPSLRNRIVPFLRRAGYFAPKLERSRIAVS